MLRVSPEFGQVWIAYPANPAAGANFTYTLPTPYHYKLDAVRFKIVTDANAANRQVMLHMYTVGAPSIYYSSTILVAENLTRYYSLWAGLNTIDRGTFSQNVCSLPPQMYLRENCIIASDIKNIQVGDLITEIQLHFRRWAP